MRGYIEVTVKDRFGNIVQKGRHEMRSFVNNLLKMIEGFMLCGGSTQSVTITLPTGSSKSTYVCWYASGGRSHGGGTPLAAKAADNDDTYGIIVGSGETPVTLNDYSVESKIAHGSGSGQLDYSPVTVEDLGLDTIVTPPVYRIRLIRTFTNHTPSTITISEVAIYARSYWKDSAGVAADDKFMIMRDVLSPPYNVPSGGIATVVIDVEVEVE